MRRVPVSGWGVGGGEDVFSPVIRRRRDRGAPAAGLGGGWGGEGAFSPVIRRGGTGVRRLRVPGGGGRGCFLTCNRTAAGPGCASCGCRGVGRRGCFLTCTQTAVGPGCAGCESLVSVVSRCQWCVAADEVDPSGPPPHNPVPVPVPVLVPAPGTVVRRIAPGTERGTAPGTEQETEPGTAPETAPPPPELTRPRQDSTCNKDRRHSETLVIAAECSQTTAQ